MKKLLMSLAAVVAIATVSAQEVSAKSASKPAEKQAAPKVAAEKASWPVWLAFNSTKNIDVVGLRLTLPYGACESVTGIDLGIVGHCRYFEGIQLNIFHNSVADIMAGFQIGIWNEAGRADAVGLQVGLWNQARAMRGVQVGLINIADTIEGFQVGIVNRAEAMYGFQAGGINVIRENEFPFLPLVNIGFDVFPQY